MRPAPSPVRPQSEVAVSLPSTVPELNAAQLAQAKQTRAEAARDLIHHCEIELAGKPATERAARLHYEMARAYEAGVSEMQKAGEHYEAALALLPDHMLSIQGARRTHLIGKRFQRAVALYDAEVRLTGDAAARAVLLCEKGYLLEDRLGKRSEAREAFATASEIDPSNAAALKALERVEQQLAAWPGLDRALELEINGVVDSTVHRAALVALRARLAEVQRNAPQAAMELYETALAIDPQAAGAVPSLKSLLRNQTRWRELCDVLKQQARQSADGRLRAMLLYQVARVQSAHLGDVEQAVLSLEAAQTEQPHDVTVQEELARQYEAAQRWQDLAKVRRKLGESALDPSSRVAALHQVGQLYEDKLNDDERALECYSAALALQPTFSPTLQALGRLCARLGRWELLVQMHLREVEACEDNEQRAATLFRVAEVYEQNLRRADLAVKHHLQALEQRPGYPHSFKAVVRLYTEVARWRELAELYEREVERASDADTKITNLFKIARIHEDCLNDHVAAMAVYQRILKVEARHLGALHALQRVAERAGQWRELVEALKLEASFVKDNEKSLLHLAAEVLEERVGDHEAALAAYKQVLELDEIYPPTLASLGRLYFRLGRHNDLLQIYRKELRTLKEPAARAALCFKMGELAEHLLANPEEALGLYKQAVEADPAHSSALAAALRLLGNGGKWGEVVRLLESEQQRVKEPAAEARVAFRLGELYEERLGQPVKALASYRRALQAIPEHPLALEAQARLLEATQDHETLTKELAREAQHSSDRTSAIAAGFRAGELYRDRLKRPQDAVAAFEGVLEKEPNHVAALLALESLYTELGLWTKLIENYQRQAVVLETPAARIAALRARCRMIEAHGTQAEVMAACQELLAASAQDPVALLALERVALAEGDTQAALTVDGKLSHGKYSATELSAHRTRLGETLAAAGNAAALDLFRSALQLDSENLAAARGMSRIAESKQDPDLLAAAARNEQHTIRDLARAAALFVAAAKLREARRDVEGATQDLEHALEAHADNSQAAELLSKLLEGAPTRLVAALSKAAGVAHSMERRAVLWRQVAEVQERSLKDRGAAISALERGLKDAPRDGESLLALAQLYASSAQWQPASDKLKQLLALDAPAPTRRLAHLRLAEISLRHLKNPVLALSQVRAVLSSDGKDKAALRLLVAIELDRGQSDAAATAVEQLLALDLSSEERAEVSWDAARVARSRGKQEDFVNLAKQAIERVGLVGEAASGLRSWLEQRRGHGERVDWNPYVDALTVYSERGDLVTQDRAETLIEIGRVYADELSQHERSLAFLGKGMRLMPNNPALTERYAVELERAGRWEEAAREYLKVLEVHFDRHELWRHLHERYRTAGRTEQARIALAPLIAQGAASENEVATYRMRAPQLPAGRNAMDATVLAQLEGAAGTEAPLTALVTSLQATLYKVFPADLARYGRDSLERLTARGGHPVRLLANRVADILGVEDFEVYLHESSSPQITVELTETPSLLVARAVCTLTEPEQAFLLARPLVAMARGLLGVERLSQGELAMLVEAGIQASESARATSAHGQSVQEIARLIGKAMPRRHRRAFEDAARAYVTLPDADLGLWSKNMRTVNARAAALIADDPAGALSLIEHRKRELRGDRQQELQSLLGDLPRFLLSDAAQSLRQRLQGR
jgi:tetratricopeptide (TPR) repeat protein